MHPLSRYRRVYVATPFSLYPGGLESAFIEACKITGRLIQAGVRAFSPIVHTYPIASLNKLDQFDLDIWLPLDESILEVCDALAVIQMPTWEISKGVKYEIAYFSLAERPIYDLFPETLEVTRHEA